MSKSEEERDRRLAESRKRAWPEPWGSPVLERRETVFASRAWLREMPQRERPAAAEALHGFVQDLVSLAGENVHPWRVLYTAEHCQLAVMSLEPGEELGEEAHVLDQFFRVEAGIGIALLDDVRSVIRAGFAVLVPAGTMHNIINAGALPLKLSTIFSAPNHQGGALSHEEVEAAAEAKPGVEMTANGPENTLLVRDPVGGRVTGDT